MKNILLKNCKFKIEELENVQFISLLSKQKAVKIVNNEIPIKPYNLSKLINNTYEAFEY